MFSGEEEGGDGVKEEESKNVKTGGRREEKEREVMEKHPEHAARLFSPSE